MLAIYTFKFRYEQDLNIVLTGTKSTQMVHENAERAECQKAP